jgi:SAM-dependent methyltransferase
MSSPRASGHYDRTYFEWQKSVGEFGGWANQTKFCQFISTDDDVLDFGCGGGYLLNQMACRKKIGVEPSATASREARANGLEVYANVGDVPDGHVDVAISNNALEHTLQPLDELKALYPKLREGGRLIFVVPCEAISHAHRFNDINHHLYSWSPMCIGNLFTEAGYEVLESRPYIHKWPPYYRFIASVSGRTGFEIACRIYGRIERSWFQVRLIAIKPQVVKAVDATTTAP